MRDFRANRDFRFAAGHPLRGADDFTGDGAKLGLREGFLGTSGEGNGDENNQSSKECLRTEGNERRG
jgi:hypothetical protein